MPALSLYAVACSHRTVQAAGRQGRYAADGESWSWVKSHLSAIEVCFELTPIFALALALSEDRLVQISCHFSARFGRFFREIAISRRQRLVLYLDISGSHPGRLFHCSPLRDTSSRNASKCCFVQCQDSTAQPLAYTDSFPAPAAIHNSQGA